MIDSDICPKYISVYDSMYLGGDTGQQAFAIFNDEGNASLRMYHGNTEVMSRQVISVNYNAMTRKITLNIGSDVYAGTYRLNGFIFY